jgi:hypothetical protein
LNPGGDDRALIRENEQKGGSMAKLIVTAVSGSSFELDVDSYESGVDQALFFMERQARHDTDSGTVFYPTHQIAKIEVRR